jgi:hypothetical protein
MGVFVEPAQAEVYTFSILRGGASMTQYELKSVDDEEEDEELEEGDDKEEPEDEDNEEENTYEV